jgi:putative flavoprotein involved in K+ transport
VSITHTDVLIVGAGHAGLAMSALLSETGCEHLVLEQRDRLGGGWLDRWDDFRLVTPNWAASFPGWAYGGPDPDGFMRRDEIAARVARYADVVGAPVELATAVQRLAVTDRGFRATTNRGEIAAREVVVATGSYHAPRIPEPAQHLSPRVVQLHSHEYRNERSLPAGAVLIVGSGQTGLQLAEELFAAGRQVFVAVGSAGRVPRRYRGRDIYGWLAEILRDGAAHGVSFPTAAQLPDPRRRFDAMPALSGHGGGHDTNLRRYALDGMRLAGRLIQADGEHVAFADDLARNLRAADGSFDDRFRPVIDAYIAAAELDAPPDDRTTIAHEPTAVRELHLGREAVSTVIWATGYELDYSWIDAPIFDGRGYPANARGTTAVPGLSFIGLLWQHSQASASLVGPEFDAPYLAERMASTPGISALIAG